MNSKLIIIVIAVIAAAAVAAGYFMFSDQLEYEHTTLVLSKSAYMESPLAENISGKPDKDGVYYYVDSENGVNVTSSSNISTPDSKKTMDKLRDEVQSNSKKSYEGDVVVYEKNGIFSVFVKNIGYNDTVLIQSLSKDMLLACWSTLKFHDPSDSLKFENNTTVGGNVINAVEQTEEVVQSAAEAQESASSSTSTSSDASDYSSSSDWGYDWSSSSDSYSSGASSSGGSGSGSVGGSASVDDFDFT